MTLPEVFIASSSEGLTDAEKIQKLLQRYLTGTAEVQLWPEKFQLTKVYIESLEQLLDRSDFAVMVLTADDLTESRDVKTASPRDNVVFEIGLFFGRLSRERCFLIKRGDLDLKLPSDLLGIEPANFFMLPGKDLEASLDPACARIGKEIRDATSTLPSRPKLGNADRAIQVAMRRFADRIAGTWWERITLKGEEPALSFFNIEMDDVHSSVRLRGTAYGPDGAHVANWRSAAARIKDNKIVYVRECERLDAETTVWRPGLGEIEFVESNDTIEQGSGKFWESDESHPDETVIKNVQLKRTKKRKHARKMQKGKETEKKALVLDRLKRW